MYKQRKPHLSHASGAASFRVAFVGAATALSLAAGGAAQGQPPSVAGRYAFHEQHSGGELIIGQVGTGWQVYVDEGGNGVADCALIAEGTFSGKTFKGRITFLVDPQDNWRPGQTPAGADAVDGVHAISISFTPKLADLREVDATELCGTGADLTGKYYKQAANAGSPSDTDRQLNATYAAVMRSLDLVAKQHLREGERAWIKLRDQTCGVGERAGDSQRSPSQLQCEETETRKRISFLQRLQK